MQNNIKKSGKSDNDSKSITAKKGFTLVEVLTGLAIFSVSILPLITITSKAAFSTKTRDLQTAYTLLKGECDIIYKNHILPPKKRDVKIGNFTYRIICDYEKDSVLTSWVLYVEKKKNVIAYIKGLVYIPESDIE